MLPSVLRIPGEMSDSDTGCVAKVILDIDKYASSDEVWKVGRMHQQSAGFSHTHVAQCIPWQSASFSHSIKAVVSFFLIQSAPSLGSPTGLRAWPAWRRARPGVHPPVTGSGELQGDLSFCPSAEKEILVYATQPPMDLPL